MSNNNIHRREPRADIIQATLPEVNINGKVYRRDVAPDGSIVYRGSDNYLWSPIAIEKMVYMANLPKG